MSGILLVALLPLAAACDLAATSGTGTPTPSASATAHATSTATPTPNPRTTPYGSQTPPAGAATVRIDSGEVWTPASVSIRPGGAVTWQNFDTANAHPVECVQQDSSATCPWTGATALPPAQRNASGQVTPTTTTATFSRPGLYTFRDANHPAARGQVVVGAPG